MIGTVVLLPIYFGRANQALLDRAFRPQDVPGELAAWSAWNWLRTGLALFAAGLSCAALAPGQGDPAFAKNST